VKVSHLCLGAMMFGPWGNEDRDECIRMVHTALEQGVNFIDTADVYGQGESERILGAALRGRRDDVVLATKFHGRMGDDPNRSGNSRRWIIKACEESLRRLQTDWIDLYQVHRPDPSCDIDETLGALTDLVRAGKVRAIGSSTFPAHEIVAAQWVAERRGRERFRCEQPPYSMFVRGIEADVLPVCQRYGMATRGRLPARYDVKRPANQPKLDAVEELLKVASDAGCSLTHVAVAWVVRHPAVTSAIVGPRTPEQLEDLLAGQDLVLDDEVLDRIDEIVPPGTTLNPADAGYTPPALEDPSARRRPR
jgi:aryl-alcohol dehydrogenase (NADP+)